MNIENLFDGNYCLLKAYLTKSIFDKNHSLLKQPLLISVNKKHLW